MQPRHAGLRGVLGRSLMFMFARSLMIGRNSIQRVSIVEKKMEGRASAALLVDVQLQNGNAEVGAAQTELFASGKEHMAV